MMPFIAELRRRCEVVHSPKWPLICVASCLIVWLVFVFALSYPGTPTNDTISQLQQAIDGDIDNWKPALYAYILKLFNYACGDKSLGLAFILQVTLFGLGYALIVWSFAKRGMAFLWAMPFIFFCNNKGINVSVIGNDALCASCFMMYFGLIFAHRVITCKTIKVVFILCAIICLFVGFVMRHNSFPAVIVMAICALTPFCKSLARSITCGVFLSVLFLVANMFVVNYVFQCRATYPLRFVYAADMINISILNNEWVPFCQQEQLRIKKKYPSPSSYCLLRADVCIFYPTGLEPFFKAADSEVLKSINGRYLAGWSETVKNNPAKYLILKTYFFHQFLLAGRSLPIIETWISHQFPHVSTYGDTICHDWRAWCNRLFLFNSLIPLIAYALLAMSLFLAYLKKIVLNEESRDALFIIGTAAAYLLTFSIFTLSSSEFRFYIITSSLSLIGVLLLLISFFRKRPASIPAKALQ